MGDTHKTVNCIRNLILGAVFYFLRASTANGYHLQNFVFGKILNPLIDLLL